MPNSPGIQVLLLTADLSLSAIFKDVSRELGVEAQRCGDCQGISDQLKRENYDAVILDLDTVPAAIPALARVRENRPQGNALLLAVATGACHQEQALENGAHFLLQRPIQTAKLRETLSTAYRLAAGERRRYFRCTVNLPVLVSVDSSGRSIQCTTINVSNHGMAISTPLPIGRAETLKIALSLPNEFMVRGIAIVIWDDEHGKAGLNIRCGSPEMSKELDSWLDSQFRLLLGPVHHS